MQISENQIKITIFILLFAFGFFDWMRQSPGLASYIQQVAFCNKQDLYNINLAISYTTCPLIQLAKATGVHPSMSSSIPFIWSIC